MAKFKEEYQNTTVIVNSPAIGKVTINTEEVDPNQWAGIKEFAFMFEEEKTENIGKIADNWEDFTLNELRERFPEIKATSKKAFIEQIPAI